MLGKGLESLIPAGGYKKSDDSSLQSYGGPNQQAQSNQSLGAYAELVVQNNNNYNGIGDFALASQPAQSLRDIDVSPINPPPQIIATSTVQLAEPIVSQSQATESSQVIAEKQFVFTPQITQASEIISVPEITQSFQVPFVSQDIPFLQNAPALQSVVPLQPVILPQALQNEPILQPVPLQPVATPQTLQDISASQSATSLQSIPPQAPQSATLLQPMPLQPVAISQASENVSILQPTISPQSVFSSHTEPLVPSDLVSQIPTQVNNPPQNILSSENMIASQMPEASQNTSSTQAISSSQLNQSPTERAFPSALTPSTIASNSTRNFIDNDLLLNPILQNNIEEDYSRKQASVFQIEVEKISPNPHQPRRHFDEDALNELANSIREFGIIQPLIVTKILKETEIGTEVSYQLIAGERRLMAAKKVGLRTVPVVIRHIGIDRERLELAIIENVQRESLGPLETARGYARLQDEFRLTQREIAVRIGKSRETVANTLRLLHLPSEIQQALDRGAINESHARLLLQINDISKQQDMFQSILRTKPSVRDLKAIIKKAKTGLETHHLSPELISLQSRLEEFLGTKTQIDDDGGRGKITINYYSPEELNALIHRLSGADI